ncbi:MAG: DNA-3-methyladenine glycosylase 2 family protein [Chloroflexi bacterium]|nr:DNA-3-methyladenine glycosylase 2 family protein [Chloroflexota bacterium]
MTVSTTGTLTPTPPFDFTQALRFIGGFAIGDGEQTLDAATLTRAVSIGGLPVAFRVRSTGTIEQPQLHYMLYADAPLDAVTQAAAADRIAFYLSIHDNLRPFYELAEADHDFAPVARDLYGYHQVKFLTPFDSACWAILSQRNLFPVASAMRRRLTERFGGQIVVEGTVYPAFPEPPPLAVTHVDEINGAVGNRWKSDGIHHVAQAFDGADETWLRSAPYDEVYRWLRRIKGVGEWSASFILLRGLGQMDRLPPGEKRILQAAERVYGRSLDEDELQRLAQPYGAHRGYWAHYLRAAL